MIQFIKSWHPQQFKFIKESLLNEGLSEEEICLSKENRIFWLMIEDKEILGFCGFCDNNIDYPILEYFWIAPHKRKKPKCIWINLIRFLKSLLKDIGCKNILIDVKGNNNFEYLLSFVERITHTKAYKQIKGNSYFFVNIEEINI